MTETTLCFSERSFEMEEEERVISAGRWIEWRVEMEGLIGSMSCVSE